MNVFYPDFIVHELAALKAPQRRTVWMSIRRAHPYWFEVLQWLFSFALVLLILFVAAPFGQHLSGHLCGAVLSVSVTTVVLAILKGWLVVWCFRSHIRRYIRDHEAELQTPD